MPILQADDIADLVKLTLKDLGRGRWTEVATTLQEFVAMPSLLRSERTEFTSGYGIQFNVMTGTSGAAEFTGLFAVDKVNVGDVMAQGSVPWRHLRSSFAIERREITMNSDPARIVELVKVRRADAMIDLAKKLETAFWNKPSGPTAPEIFGVDYWVVRNTTQGFNGANPAGFTDTGGIDRATVANWKNYTDQYTNVTAGDFVKKMRRAATFTNFMSPVDIPSYNAGNRYAYYTNYTVLGVLEELAVAQNDRLGPDVASMDGQVVFRRLPIVWVPQLEGNAVNTDPLYGINWGVFRIAFLRGEYLRETGPMAASNQHNVLQVHIDLSANVVCYDPRRCFVIAK